MKTDILRLAKEFISVSSTSGNLYELERILAIAEVGEIVLVAIS